jgi:hypothetical protein
MLDFIHQSPVKIIFGESNLFAVVEETRRFGERVLLVLGGESFRKNGHYEKLTTALLNADMEIYEMSGIRTPILSKVREGIALCREKEIDVILGIGGGTCMDMAKAIAFGVFREEDVWGYFTGEFQGEGLSHLPVGTIVTFPSSGSELDPDAQITNDETGESMGLDCIFPDFAWLNPSFMMSISNENLVKGQITAFVQLSIGYLGLERSEVPERVSVALIKSILSNLRKSVEEPLNQEPRANLMLASALTVSGMPTFGKDGEWAIYPLQAVMQNICQVPYTISLAVLFPYWLDMVYGGQEIFKDYFVNVFDMEIAGKTDEQILHDGIKQILELYRSFGYPVNFKECSNRIDEGRLKEMIEMIGPISSIYTELTTEKIESMMIRSIKGKD